MSNYRNERVDELFDTARSVVDPTKRLEMYEELLQIVNDEAALVPIYFPVKVYSAKTDLVLDNVDTEGVGLLINMHWN